MWEGFALPRNMFIPSVCGAAAWTANVNIGSRRGVWGNRVSPRPRPAGAWGNRVSPCPHPREGLGGRSPPRNNRRFIAALCGAAAWTANVNKGPRGMGKPGFPIPQRTRASGPRTQAPAPGRVWEGYALPRSMFIASGCGAAARTANVKISPRRGGWGNRVSPCPHPREGLALTQGYGETGFPHTPAHGRVWEGKALPGEPCYPLADAGRRPAHPGPGPWEGLGGRSPPRNNRRFIAALCGAAAWTADVKINRPREGVGGLRLARNMLCILFVRAWRIAGWQRRLPSSPGGGPPGPLHPSRPSRSTRQRCAPGNR